MKIHREGHQIIFYFSFLLLSLLVMSFWLVSSIFLLVVISFSVSCFISFLFRFFRYPNRTFKPGDKTVLCPADGKIVVIEKAYEKEYLKRECTLVSIFMSIWDVHVNWYPIAGKITYYKHHPGKFIVAKQPKSSEMNERNSIVIKNNNGLEILTRQIAGTVARRIVSTASLGRKVVQGEEMGIIRFGSRVDIYLPPEADVLVKLNDKVKARKDLIAFI